MNKFDITKLNMNFFYTNLLGLDQLHDYKPEDRLAKSEILENLKFLMKNIKKKGGGLKTLKQKKERKKPYTRKEDKFLKINKDLKIDNGLEKNFERLLNNYLYQIIYFAFGYINLNNFSNSELIISLLNLKLYLDSYQNDIYYNNDYDNEYKNDLLINIKITIEVINNLVKYYLEIINENIQEQDTIIQKEDSPVTNIDLEKDVSDDDEDDNEDDEEDDDHINMKRKIKDLDDDEDDTSRTKRRMINPINMKRKIKDKDDDEDDTSRTKIKRTYGGNDREINLNDDGEDVELNIKKLIKKFLIRDIKEIIYEVEQSFNFVEFVPKKIEEPYIEKMDTDVMNGGAPKIKFDNNNINQLIRYYYNILKNNLNIIKKFFIEDISINFYIPNLSINLQIIKIIKEYEDFESSQVNDNSFNEDIDTPTNEYINRKLSNFLNLLDEYNKVIISIIPNQLKKINNEFNQQFNKINIIELGLIQVWNLNVKNNNEKNIDNIDKNISTINVVFSGDNIALQNIIYSTDVLLKKIIKVSEEIEEKKADQLSEQAKAVARAKKLEAKKAADAAAQAINANNNSLTFINKFEERKMANNILILIAKIIKNLLKPLNTDLQQISIEKSQFEILDKYDVSFNSVDKNVYAKLEESLLELFGKKILDLSKDLNDLSSNIFKPKNLQKCYYINNAAQGTFGDGSELQEYRYCPLGSLIDAAGLKFGGCSYNAPIGKKVSPPDNNENYIETGDINIEFKCPDPNYSYNLIINKKTIFEYDINIKYNINSFTFETKYIHDINNSSISASNIYKNLLDLFITTLKGKDNNSKKWGSFLLDNDFIKKFLAESTKKGLGDFLQTVNTVFKYGGFIQNLNYIVGNNIIRFDSFGDAPRLNLATDQISSCLFLYIANEFPQENINKYCWGGYKSSSKLLIKNKPQIPTDIFGGKKVKRKTKKLKIKRKTKTKKVKRTKKIKKLKK